MTDNNWIRHLAHHLTGAVLCVAAFAAMLTPAVLMADESNKKTTITFSAPVEIPGKVLPAGTYVFKLLDSSSNRNIVQIFDQDETHVIATLLAVSTDMIQPPDQTIVRFAERASNEPEAVKAWFYPGESVGWEFVYPEDRASAIAKRTKQNVLSMRKEMKENINSTSTSVDNPGTREMQHTEVSTIDSTGKNIGPMASASNQSGK